MEEDDTQALESTWDKLEQSCWVMMQRGAGEEREDTLGEVARGGLNTGVIGEEDTRIAYSEFLGLGIYWDV